ncbi:MAG: hypothetical protein JEZ06_14585 [Anaerolineaceae bacterium]|nr:hypothetical protein [Anaerolineaceae bacterium]
MNMYSNDFELLEEVEKGNLSVDQAIEILEIKDRDNFEENPTVEPDSPVLDGSEINKINQSDLKAKLSRFWIPLFISMLLMTVLSTVWMYQSFIQDGFRIEVIFSFIFLFISILGMSISWRIKQTNWIVVRIEQSEEGVLGNKQWEFVLPASMAIWSLKLIKGFLSDELQKVDLIEFIETCQDSVSEENPLSFSFESDRHSYQIEFWVFAN